MIRKSQKRQRHQISQLIPGRFMLRNVGVLCNPYFEILLTRERIITVEFDRISVSVSFFMKLGQDNFGSVTAETEVTCFDRPLSSRSVLQNYWRDWVCEARYMERHEKTWKDQASKVCISVEHKLCMLVSSYPLTVQQSLVLAYLDNKTQYW